MSFIIDVETLHKRLQTKLDETVVFDVRFNLAEPNEGRKSYVKGHIPTASYLDLNRDLSGPAQKHGGAHPLPDIQLFAKKIGHLGVDETKTVVIYDQGDSMYASRAWWLLNYLGHKQTYVLDGGLKKWGEAGYDVTTEIACPAPTIFKPNVAADATVDIKMIKDNIKNKQAILIDSRSHNRYLGVEEPLYEKAGHIPGAKNFFWQHVLNENGTWKGVKELKENFSTLPNDQEIIVSCGSGVSACPNILALKMAGYDHVKLYPGSFSDWISYEENQVETKEE